MEKFDAIEKLIEKGLPAPMPKILGDGPEWRVRNKKT